MDAARRPGFALFADSGIVKTRRLFPPRVGVSRRIPESGNSTDPRRLGE